MLYIIKTKIFFVIISKLHHRFKNLIITSKVKGEGIKEVSIGKAYSNRASQRKHQTYK
jgi:hypothetical protein